MYSELIAVIFGVAITLIFKFVPALDVWFQTKVSKDWRGLIMLGFSVLVPFGILGASCLGLTDAVACEAEVIPDLITSWLAFMVANQGLFLTTPNSPEKKRIEAAELAK